MALLEKKSLSKLLQNRLEKGINTFSNDAILNEIEISKHNLLISISRLKKNKRIISPIRGFHVIVPEKFRSEAYVPVEDYLNALMIYLKKPYYLCLLTAAKYHGATHQAVMETQIMVENPRPQIIVGQTRIRFFGKKNMKTTETFNVSVNQGDLPVSIAIETFVDLLSYQRGGAGLSHIATVLIEMIDSFSLENAKNILINIDNQALLRRAGFLFEFLGFNAYANQVENVLKQKKNLNTYSLLAQGKSIKGAHKNEKWKLFINDDVEPDY